jgi:putative flippase GtrA
MSNTITDSDIVLKLRLIKTDIYAYLGLIMFVIRTIGNVCNIVVFLYVRSISNLVSRWLLLASFINCKTFINFIVNRLIRFNRI